MSPINEQRAWPLPLSDLNPVRPIIDIVPACPPLFLLALPSATRPPRQREPPAGRLQTGAVQGHPADSPAGGQVGGRSRRGGRMSREAWQDE
eukprot:9487576-Pyramimonas_sp.AAC.2